MKKPRKSFRVIVYLLLVVAVLTLLLVPFSVATTVDWENSKVPNDYVEPGQSGIKVMQFVLSDGGDYLMRNSTVPGDDLYSFQNNRTMFLNQSYGSQSGLNGFNDGEDIFRVSRVHTGAVNETIGNSTVRNFSTDTLYADGGTSGNKNFDGDNGISDSSEVIIRDNGSESGKLDKGDFVLSSGGLNFSTFDNQDRYTDVNGNFRFDGGKEAIIGNGGGAPGKLEPSDTVLKSGEAGLELFSGNVSYANRDGSPGYSGGNAIVLQKSSGVSEILEPEPVDRVLTNGTADILMAENTMLSYLMSRASRSTMSPLRMGL
mgnify:FL=1